MEQNLVSSPQNEENIKKNNNKFNEKLKILKTKEFWTCRMYNYFTLKFFKSIGMMIFFGIILGLSLAIQIPSIYFNFNISYDGNEVYEGYLSNLICYVLVISVIFSVTLSGLIIKDEIRNKTMLIFASLPMSRKRMFTEQLLSFLTINTILIFTLTFILPLFYLFFGSGSFALLKVIYTNAALDFIKLLFICMVISTIMLFFVLIFSDKAMKILSPFLAVISLIALMLPMILSFSASNTFLSSMSMSRNGYQKYNYFAEKQKQLKLNKLDNKYLDLDDWFNSSEGFMNTMIFSPDNLFMYGWNINTIESDNIISLELQSDSYLNEFISNLLNPDFMNQNFNELLNHMKIDNNNIIIDNNLSSTLDTILKSSIVQDNIEFATNNKTSSNDYNLVSSSLKNAEKNSKDNSNSLFNVYQTIYENNKHQIQNGPVIKPKELFYFLNDLISKIIPADKQNDAQTNLQSYLEKENNKSVYINDAFFNYILYPTLVVKAYASSQVFEVYNSQNETIPFGQTYLNKVKKQLMNTNLLFSFNPFLQFYKIGFYNEYNTIETGEYGLGTIQINDFNVSLKTMTIFKGKDTYNIIYADMKSNHTTLAIWALYIFWTIFSVILIISSYVIYSRKDFK